MALTETGGQTVAGGSDHHCTSLLWSGEAAESLCQISSCTTDCNYLAWFWPGLAHHYCVPTHRPVPSACCHQPITQCPVPSGGLTWCPAGFHPAQRTSLCQQLKMCSGVHHQLPEVITNFIITNSTHSSVRRQWLPISFPAKTERFNWGVIYTFLSSNSNENIKRSFFHHFSTLSE